MMDVLGWLWWTAATALAVIWSLVWFLVGGWVSTLLQITLLVAVVYYFKYGWQRAPGEVWRRARGFGRFFWNWISARETPAGSEGPVREVVRVVHVKEFGDINFSTLLSLLALVGLMVVTRL
jgi:hypothetical protein